MKQDHFAANQGNTRFCALGRQVLFKCEYNFNCKRLRFALNPGLRAQRQFSSLPLKCHSEHRIPFDREAPGRQGRTILDSLRGTREAGKDSLDSLRGSREAGKDQLHSLQGTREAGKSHLDSLRGTREAGKD